MPRSERRTAKIRDVLSKRQPDLTVVMENIHDPHNVSAVLRSCDAVGVMRVELLYNVEKFPRIGKKSSSSANKWLERRKHTDVAECYSTLRQEGFAIYATHLGTSAVSLYDLDLTKKVALVFGNEHRGVSDEAATLADGNFVIPMVGMIQSLNISVACAVSLYEALRQRMECGAFDASKFSDTAFRELFEQWIKL
ncbi:MAG: RNA methyltransferase [Ignavibacteriae bacterium]|nr:RNA methyltransferase [Ignavibacteriota bacterium]